MGYDLYWAEDPYAEWRDNRLKAWEREHLPATFRDSTGAAPSLAKLLAVSAEVYGILQADGAYFRASMNTAHQLIDELALQGATDMAAALVSREDMPAELLRREVPLLRRDFYALHEYFSEHGLEAVDEVHPLEEWLDHVVSVGLTDAVDSAAPGTCPSCGQSVTASETWAERWARFVDFLQAAADHGGVRVS